ncbi:MAG: hypothetical protein ACODAE_07395 [Gemmatimonadota bacterium]
MNFDRGSMMMGFVRLFLAGVIALAALAAVSVGLPIVLAIAAIGVPALLLGVVVGLPVLVVGAVAGVLGLALAVLAGTIGLLFKLLKLLVFVVLPIAALGWVVTRFLRPRPI